MITIIHGDDVVSSRRYLQGQKNATGSPYIFDGAIDISNIIQIAQGGGLFSSEKKIFLENFFSKNKLNSSQAKAIIDYINKNESLFDIYIWEGKELQKKFLTVFDKLEVKIFKIPQSIFLFLDNIKPGSYKFAVDSFHKALENTEIELIFFMLQRQFRLLVAISDKKAKKIIDEILRLASWQRNKLERQAKLFSMGQLREIYKRLYEIELAQKTGNLPFSLREAIDFLLVNI